MLSAFITGVAGQRLSLDETGFLGDAKPCGLILFGRNCAAPEQVRALIDDFRAAVGTGAVLVAIDQEGGPVQRLGPPSWRALPPACSYGTAYARGAAEGLQLARLAGELTAHDLAALGINMNMVPVLDLPLSTAHPIIGDRAYGREPEQVAALGRAVAEGHMTSGVCPVMKHIPGHGRANADSHFELPVVETALADLRRQDFAPFNALKDLPAAMSAHVVYGAVDPDAPASTSALLHQRIIRGEIGFDGLLMSDDLSMKALDGPMSQRAAAVIGAGSDLALHCNGNLAEMEAVAAAVPRLAGRALERFERALAVTKDRKPVDISAAEAALAEVLALTG